MKLASDFRKSAREALKGKWGIAVIAGLIASLLGGTGSVAFNIDLNFEMPEEVTSLSGLWVAFQNEIAEITAEINQILPEAFGVLIAVLAILTPIILAICAVFFVLASVIEVGYMQFNLNAVDKGEPKIENLFGFFGKWKGVSVAMLLRALYTYLWSLLLIVPGIIARYSYAATPYILAENPDMKPSEAISKSVEIMRGNRWRLFCLKISFIGWVILSVLTFGIGDLWLLPYMKAAEADFYREISGTRPVAYPEFDESAFDMNV